MNNVIFAEFFKLKHSKILWLIWFGALLPAVLYSISSEFSADSIQWDYWFSNQFSILLIFSPPLFALITGYITGREYQHKTINNLLTYPYSRFHFLAGKMIVAVTLIVFTCLLAFIANILSGHLFTDSSITKDDFLTYFVSYLVMTSIIISVVPLWMFVSILGKSSTMPIVISLVIITLPGPIGGGSAYSEIVHYVLRIAERGDPVNISLLVSLFGSLFILFLILSSIIYVKSDVHSGT